MRRVGSLIGIRWRNEPKGSRGRFASMPAPATSAEFARGSRETSSASIGGNLIEGSGIQ
jgi:hypothetical protein